jgi:hypothetical protein
MAMLQYFDNALEQKPFWRFMNTVII